jgi:hypothetical protein
MKYRVFDMYENPHGDLICTADNLLSALGKAADFCLDTDGECNLVVKTNEGGNVMFGCHYSDFIAAIDLMRGLYNTKIITMEV